MLLPSNNISFLGFNLIFIQVITMLLHVFVFTNFSILFYCSIFVPEYRLIGIVSHSGTSTLCGHYVAHVLKDGRWVIFNDNKVGASINPPKEMGYLYFFERL